MKIDRLKAYTLILNTEGKIFTATFLKKDGSERKMNCRLEVTKGVKGVGLKYNPAKKELISVYDVQSRGFRTINLRTLISLKISGRTYTLSSVKTKAKTKIKTRTATEAKTIREAFIKAAEIARKNHNHWTAKLIEQEAENY